MALKTQKTKTFMAMVVLTMTCILALTAEAATFTDDFSAGINPAHYTVTAGAYTIDGTQGDVRMSKPYGPGAWAQLFFNHDVYGDFDISVDYRDAVLAGDHNQIQLNLSFGGQYIVDRRENWEGSRYSVWIDPPANIYGATGTADTAGKLRVTRIGSTITCYANDTQIYQGDFNSSPVTDLWLSLQNNGTEDAISVTFDNFSITADGIDCNPSGMVSWWKAENNAVDSSAQATAHCRTVQRMPPARSVRRSALMAWMIILSCPLVSQISHPDLPSDYGPIQPPPVIGRDFLN